MGLLDAFLYGYRELVDAAGNVALRRDQLKIIGGTLADDGTRTVLTVTGGSGGEAVPNAVIVWKPGEASIPGKQVATWAEVKSILLVTVHELEVIVDTSLAAAHVLASTGITDCDYRVTLRGEYVYTTVTIDAGATLVDLWRLRNCVLVMPTTSAGTPALDFTYELFDFYAYLYLEGASGFQNLTGSAPSCTVPDAKQLIVIADCVYEQGFVEGSAGKEVFDVSGTGVLDIESLGSFYVFTNSIKGGASSSLAFLIDGAWRGSSEGSLPTFANYLGTLVYQSVRGTRRWIVNDTVKTAAYTAKPGEVVHVDTSGGNVPITLPASQYNGTEVCVVSVAVSANTLTVVGTINGATNDAFVCSAKRSRIYTVVNGSWKITAEALAGASTPPTGNYLAKVTAGAYDAASVQVTDSLVATGAAIAGTKVAPDFGAQDIVTTGIVALGASPPASSALLRFGGAGAQTLITVNALGAISALAANTASGDVAFGSYGSGYTTYGGYSVGLKSFVSITANRAIIGDSAQSSQYAVHGLAPQAMANADQTAASSVYCMKTIECTGIALTADRTLTLPPATDATAVEHTIVNLCAVGAFGIIVSVGAGTTVKIASGANGFSAQIRIDSGGVSRVTPDTVLI